MTRLLLLAGSGEAAAFAAAAAARFGERLELLASLGCGADRPVPRPAAVRIGPFGGAEGLARYLAAERIDLVVDACDPFAASRSAEAHAACLEAAVPRLRLLPPAWTRDPLDRWIEVERVDAAARTVRQVARRAFLGVGDASLADFAGIHEVNFLVRLATAPRERLPLRFYEVVLGRGPFSLAQERHLFERHAIDVVVARATGGAAPAPALLAAREASLPVVMIRRPPPPPGDTAEGLAAALEWLAARLG